MSFGIALGGGGAKGLAHIGVLQVFEEYGVRPAYVAGTSIGAIVGGIYCLDGSAQRLEARAKEMINSEEFKKFGLDAFCTEDKSVLQRFKKEVFEKFYFSRLLFQKSHIEKTAAQQLFNNLFKQKTFEECRLRFTCNALDIQTGEEIIFTSGPLSDAVWASCAIPGILPPYERNKQILVDGGVIDNIPVGPVIELGARIVVASYLGQARLFAGVPETGYQINQRAQSFVRYYLDKRILAQADLVIHPAISQIHWADFSSLEFLIEKGREAAKKSIKKIKRVTSKWNYIKKTVSMSI